MKTKQDNADYDLRKAIIARDWAKRRLCLAALLAILGTLVFVKLMEWSW